MVEHKCVKCGKTFYKMDRWRIHANRKRSCEPNLSRIEILEHEQEEHQCQ